VTKIVKTLGIGWQICLGAFVAVVIFCPLPGESQTRGAPSELRVQVIDENGQPVPRVEVAAHWGSGNSQITYTDAVGRFELRGISTSQVQLSLSKPGFFRIDDRILNLEPGANEATLTLNHETELQEKLEVQSEPVQIDPDTTSHQESLVEHEILNTPVPSSHDLQQNLRTIPQVIADVNGRLHVAGARQAQTEVLLDGFEINDPATGTFTSRVNVDAVRTVTIETGGYGAQYAHASAGILALDTQSGDDKWRFGVTNFIPDVSFEQGTHFGNWYPRASVSGPISKGRAWFSDALSLQHNFRLVKELPSGQNIDTQWSGDNLVRGRVNLTAQNILLGSFLFNRLTDPRQGLNPFAPLSTTSNFRSTRYFVSVKDQIWVGRTLFEVGGAVDTGGNDGTPQGTAPYVVTPSATSGNYFQAFSQRSRRLQLVGDVTTGALALFGTHTLSAGWNADGLDFSQQASRSEIDFRRADAASSLSEVATFSGSKAFSLANTQIGGYVQDLWRPFKPVVFSVGVRSDWDRLIHENVVEPRMAMNWVPKGDGRMKFTLAWGKHYQPPNLSIFGQGLDQRRVDQFYSPPPVCTPIPLCVPATPTPLGPPIVTSFVVIRDGLQQPRSYNTTAEWQERFFESTFVGASFLLRESRDGFAWETQPAPASGTLLLENNREDRYVAGEVWVRHAFSDKAQIELDYTRSRTSSNEVLDPNLAFLILAQQQPLMLARQQAGPLLWDAPHRIVSSGWTPIPLWGLLLSEFFEYRTGFPFSVLNEQQQLIGAPNRLRFPNYISLNLGLEKRFQFRGHEWAVRVTGVNITGHHNPDTVVNNIDAPNYLNFAGGQRRAFTVRLRLVTQH
jgi:hypothetical protein